MSAHFSIQYAYLHAMKPDTVIAKITSQLSSAFSQLGISVDATLRLEQPADPQFGHFACAYALQAFRMCSSEQKSEFKSPRELATRVVAHLTDHSLIECVSVAGPGFINLKLKEEILWKVVATKAVVPNFEPTSRSAIVEYVSPNTNKPLHIGHLRNAALGASLANLLESGGSQVTRTLVFNDRGLHIMKSAWSYLIFGTKSNPNVEALKSGHRDDSLITRLSGQVTQAWSQKLVEWREHSDHWLVPANMTAEALQKPDHFVGYWYQLADASAENQDVQTVWGEMLRVWEDASAEYHAELRSLWTQLNEWFYQGFSSTQQRLGFSFDQDSINYESAVYLAGKEIVLKQADEGVFVRLKDGAIKADLSAYHLPDKVLLRRDGTGIYMTFDIELTRRRVQSGADELFWVVGADQTLYFQQLFAVAEMLGYGAQKKFTHVAYGMVRLPEGKMSSRKGLVVYADDLLDVAVEKAKQVMLESNLKKDLSEEEFTQISEAVGVGAVKWTMLSVDAVSEITFNIEESISFKGFAGPYVQYTYARAKSVLRKASERNIAIHYDTLLNDLIYSQTDDGDSATQLQESDLLRNLFIYYETLQHSADARSPHHLCTYLYNLCQSFNSFYNVCSVLGEDVTPAVTNRRLALVSSTADVLHHGLTLLGIKPVEKM